MKTTTLFFVLLLFFVSCKKEKEGNVIYKVKYTTLHNSKSINKGIKEDLYYTQFGDYITSITPKSFIGTFYLIRIYGKVNASDVPPVFMTLINHNTPGTNTVADFSNNAEVTVTPGLSGPFVHGPDDQALPFFEYDAYMKLLHVNIQNFTQILELPTQYETINLAQFNYSYGWHNYSCDSVKNGNILSVDMYPFIWKIYDSLDIFKYPLNFYFGMIDQTTLYTGGPEIPFPDEIRNESFGYGMPQPFIWSNKYTEWTLKRPENGETVTVTVTLGFDNENLIQIYAGSDNIPYTSDDVLVYAPNFWDRIYVNAITE